MGWMGYTYNEGFLLVGFVSLEGLGFVGCQGKLCAVQLSQKY